MLLACNLLMVHVHVVYPQRVCSHESGKPREVRYFTYCTRGKARKHLFSNATPQMQGEIQNSIHTVGKHAHKQRSNVCFLCSCFAL